MKKSLLSAILILLIAPVPLVSSLQSASLGNEAWTMPKNGAWDFNSDDSSQVGSVFSELVIGLDNMQTSHYSGLMSLIANSKGKLIRTIAAHEKMGAIVAEIPVGAVSAFVSKVRVSKLAEYIEPNVMLRADFTPNDPYWAVQWGPAKIQADAAWNVTTGSASVLVAVVDTGIDWNHPDLASNYVQLGYDWVNHDPAPMDDQGHGTHVAGTIAATINNNVGIAGLANVRIMAEKVLDENGTGWVSDVAQGIIHAVDSGANIINLSLGGPVDSAILLEALRYAFDQDVLVVAAAGNDAESTKHYPAAYDEVVAVSATTSYDNVASFSNYGDWIDVAAPGVRIYSTVLNGFYAYNSGTSMASPHVAGVAALIWSRFPSMTRDQVWAQLQYTADDLGASGFDAYYGFGRINAKKAVEQAPADHDLLVSRVNAPQYVSLGMEGTINATILNMGNRDESAATVELLVNGSVARYLAVGSLASGASKTLSVLWTPTTTGIYNATVHILPVPGETSVGNNAFFKEIVVGSPRSIAVPGDYGTIQSALDAAGEGDTILVSSGTYRENIQIVKSGLALIGENRKSTIIDGGGRDSVVFVTADKVRIDGFTIQNGGEDNVGIWLVNSNENTINNTVVLNSTYGIFLDSSSGTTMRNSVIVNNTYNFGLDGESVTHYVQDIDGSNTVNGKPISYLVNQHDTSVHGDAGYVAVVNSTNISVEDVNLTGDAEGILFAFTVDSSIENVTASDNGLGVYLYKSMNNRINDSSFVNNEEGVTFVRSKNNTVSFNKLYNNSFGLDIIESYDNFVDNVEAFNNTNGVFLEASGHNSLRSNSITGNSFNFGVAGTLLDDLTNDIDASNTVDGKPIYYWVNQSNKQFPKDAGYVGAVNCANITVAQLNLSKNVQSILFAYVTNGTISGNKVAENDRDGIALYYSHNNKILENELTGNRVGIEIDGSNNNRVYHNKFAGNSEDAFNSNSTTTWDNGYPSGGNHWSDYGAIDLHRGTHQNETGSDGISDNAHIIDKDNNDSYPLIKPYSGPHDVGIRTVDVSRTSVAKGYVANISTVTMNYGEQTETFNLTVEADSTILQIQTLTLTVRNTTTTTLSVNTIGLNYGNHTLNIHAGPLPGETDTEDNTFYSWILVTIPGDVNGGFTVDIYDALILAGALNSKPGSPNWNLNADVNYDGAVDIYDAIVLANNYGKTA